jgi:hypothetical protein
VGKEKRGGNGDGLKIRGGGNRETEKGRRAEQRRQRKPRKIQTTKAASKHEGIHSMEEESISF